MSTTQDTLNHHLQAFSVGLDEILSDYTDDSVLYTPDGPVRGLAAIRAFFEAFGPQMPEGWLDNFEMLRMDVDGEYAYIVWKVGDDIPLGTDTFVIRDGKIMVQTFAAHMG